MFSVTNTINQCYKTFQDRNLQRFTMSQSSCPGKPVQPSLMFTDKAAASFRCSTLGLAAAVSVPQILEQDRSDLNWQTHQRATVNTTVKSFIAHASPGLYKNSRSICYKTFRPRKYFWSASQSQALSAYSSVGCLKLDTRHKDESHIQLSSALACT